MTNLSNIQSSNIPSSQDLGQTPTDESGMDAIEQLNELMLQLTELLKKMRNLTQNYNVKQQELGWDVQVAGIANKRKSIDENYSAAMATGVTEIVSGVIGGAGAGAAGAGALGVGGAALSSLGDITTHVGQGVGKGIEGTGKWVSASDSKEAELDKTISEFNASNAQSYAKGVNELSDKARQISEQMRASLKELCDLYSRISTAVKL